MKANEVNFAPGIPTPWYREPWPWLLMALPAAAVVAGFFTLWLAVTTNDGLVADDYYKAGLAINKTLARDERAHELNLSAHCKLDAEGIVVVMTAREGMILPGRLRLTISHPTRAGLDQVVDLTGISGKYHGAIRGLTMGRWQLILEDAAHNWRLTGAVRIPDDREITLGATDLRPVD